MFGSRKASQEQGRPSRVVSAQQSSDDPMQRASRNGVYFLQAGAVAVVFLAVCALWWAVAQRIDFFTVVAAVLASVLLASSMHVAQQWERMVVMRLGKFKGVKGPGLFFTMPFVEYSTMRVDTRVRSTSFGAEETLSCDLVPLDVDAVVFWMVHDAEKACSTVDDYALQLLYSAQTILRDAIGRASAAEVASRRDQLDRELKRLLEEKVAPWGLTVLSVEVRDILLPEALQDVMSAEAQAEQQKKARLILMEAETSISEIIGDFARTYDDETALDLRKMYLLYEGIKEGKGAMVVPSSWNEGFADKVVEGAAKR
ncbi:slipin family protein [Adlercreutzia aquisgranensis]|uniref:slipin family protein n=1 Tax=Adlercreutzia aquisgranensis TaxID=2941323 RepID=UPI0020403BEB|nr:slipin family protein [Adlercreutzia aquisgranensis]